MLRRVSGALLMSACILPGEAVQRDAGLPREMRANAIHTT